MNSYLRTTRERFKFRSLMAFFATLACAVGLALPAKAARFGIPTEGTKLTVTGESCVPANGALDPGETNTVAFVIQNTSGGDLANVKASLIANPASVTFVSGQVTVGALAKDAKATVSFTFVTTASCGAQVSPVLEITADGGAAEQLTYGPLTTGTNVDTPSLFTNTANIEIKDNAKAGTYPSEITVANVPNAVTKVRVTLKNLSHQSSSDIDAILVGPTGKKVKIFSDVGFTSLNNTTITLDDSASQTLPPQANTDPIPSGTYKPADYGVGADPFPDLDTTGFSTSLSAFNGENPNGKWQLYIVDDSAGATGAVGGGWELEVITTARVCCGPGFPTIASNDVGASIPNMVDPGIAEDTADTTVNFFVNSTAFTADKLAVQAFSTDQNIIPDANLKLTTDLGNARLRTLKFTPAKDATGTVTISLRVQDPNGNSGTASFQVKFNAVNDSPTVTPPANISLNSGASSAPLSFTVGDAESDPGSLAVTATSSDTSVVANQNIFLGGSGANRTIQIINPNSVSSARTVTITISASDGVTAPGTASFRILFTPTGFPTISPINDVTIEQGKSGNVSFTIGDDATDVASLQVTATASPSTLLPSSGLVLGGSGASRTISITPNIAEFGLGSITITVRDAANNSTTTTFAVNVTQFNQPPTISSITPQTMNEDQANLEVAFSVSDVGAQDSTLGVSVVSSSDTSLIPVGNVVEVTPVTSGARKVRITPIANQFGRSVITLRVTDAGGKAADSVFDVTVVPVNDAPTLGDLRHQVTGPNPIVGDTDANDIEIVEDAADQTVLFDGITAGPGNETGQSLTVTATSDKADIIANPTVSYTSPGATGSLKFKPVANKSGTVIITVTVTDNGGTANGGVNSVSKKFRVIVAPDNDAPTVSDIAAQSTSKNTPISNTGVSVVATVGDIETPVDQLVLTATSRDTTKIRNSGIFVSGSGANRIITAVPEQNQIGSVVIDYIVADKGDGASAARQTAKSFTINILDVNPNTPPTITYTGGDISVDEDSVVTRGFSVADAETPLANLAVLKSSDNQALVPNENIIINGTDATRAFAIVPAADKTGTANITISVRDADPLVPRTASFTFKLTVVAIEDQPLISLKSPSTITTLEDTATADSATSSKLIEFTTSDAETPVDALTFERVSSNSSLIPEGNIVISGPSGADGKTRTVSITPASNQNGSATITIRVVDGTGLKAQFSQVINVTAVNDAPTLDPIANESVAQNSAAKNVTLTGITRGGGTDENAQTLTVTATSDKPAIVPNPVVGGVGGDGKATLTFTPASGGFGTAVISVKVEDNGGTANGGINAKTNTFTINVGQVNSAPTIAVIPNQSVDQNKSTSVIAVTIGDAETPLANLVVTASSDNQSLVPNSNISVGGSAGNRGLIITPAQNAFGTAKITVTVTDTGTAAGVDVKSTSREFILTVNQVKQNPVIGPIADVVTSINLESDIVSFTVSDVETAAENLILTADSSSNTALAPLGNIQFGGNGGTRLMIIIPARDQFGESTIRLKVVDGDNQFGTREFKFKVARPNELPTITTVANQIVDQGASTPELAVRVTDKETAAGFLQLAAKSSNTSLVPVENIVFGGRSQDRTVKVTPLPTGSGDAIITLTVTDFDGGKAETSFTVSVRSNNTPPTISLIGDVVTLKNTPTPVIPFTVGDAQTALGFLQVSATSSDTTVIPVANIFYGGSQGNRTVFITPAVDKTGTSTITLTVKDAGNLTASSSFKVTVTDVTAKRPDDLNGDSKSDIVFQDAEGNLAAWFMDKENLTSASLFNPSNSGDASWKVAALADFNQDGKPDLAFQHTDGTLAAWYLDGVALTSPTLFNPSNPGAGWRAADAADFNGDGKSDLLLQNTDGTLAVWYLDGVNLTSPTVVNPSNPGAGWSAAAANDFNSDGNTDIAFQHTDGTLAVWYMNGVDLNSPALFNPSNPGDVNWRAAASTDLDADGNSDLIFQHTDGTLAAWFLNGVDLISAKLLNPANAGGTWRVVAP